MIDQTYKIEDVDDAEAPLWERVTVANEEPETDPYDGATVMVHTVETPIRLVLDELATLKLVIARNRKSEAMLEAALAQYVVDEGPLDHERMTIKIRKGVEKTDHEGAVMSHMASGHVSWAEVSGACQNHAKISWAKVSGHLGVPKSTLGRYTSEPAEPTVSFKLKEPQDE